MASSHYTRGHYLPPLTGVPAPFDAPALAVSDDTAGGAFTATLSGGVGGAANTLYRAQFTGRAGPIAWVEAGSRTGPGIITGVAPAGYYLWGVSSVVGDEQAFSDLYYANLTTGVDALYQRILDGTEAAINALATGLTAYQRKDESEKNVTYPCLMVTPWGEVETVGPGDRLADEVGYPVRVTLETRTLHAQDSQGQELGWRQQVTDGLGFQRLAGVPEVQTCLPEHRPVFEPGGADPVTGAPFTQANADRLSSGVVFRFVARVARRTA
jgi:hypothetical protein